MTRALPRACAKPACPHVQPCPDHPRDPRPPWADRRNTTRQSRGYDARWLKARNRYRRDHPWCEWPGCGERMAEVDHVIPLALGGARLDPGNFQSLCAEHHKQKTAAENSARRGKGRRDHAG